MLSKGQRQNDKPATTLPARFEPKFWTDADQRSAIVREIRRRYDALCEDTGADSQQKFMLIQRIIFLNIQLETLECQAAEGGKLDFGTYTQAVNALSGLLSKLGLNRVMKTVPTLRAYLAGQEDTA